MENSVCSQCGQLSHCLPDNIDSYRADLLPRFLNMPEINWLKLRVPGSNYPREENLITVLHIAAHLGGGVGKALSGLIARAISRSTKSACGCMS